MKIEYNLDSDRLKYKTKVLSIDKRSIENVVTYIPCQHCETQRATIRYDIKYKFEKGKSIYGLNGTYSYMLLMCSTECMTYWMFSKGLA